MFSSQSAFAGGVCFTDSNCNNNGQNLDGNPCTGVVQCVLGVCAQPPSTGAPCSDGFSCTTGDTCLVGVCVPTGLKSTGSACGSSLNNQCTDPDTCSSIGICLPNDETPGTSCNDGFECTTGDVCIALGLCTGLPKSAGTACGSSANNQCTIPDTCTILGICNPNDALIGTGCDDNNECTTGDVCNGIGSCNPVVLLTGTTCGDSSDTECTDPDICDSGNCQSNDESANTLCGDAGTQCTNQDTCNGAGACTDNGFEPGGTSCDADGDFCTDPDTCDGSGTCIQGPHVPPTQIAGHTPGDEVCFPTTVGGKTLSLDSTSLLVSGASSSAWMIPVVLSILGIGLFVVSRKSE